MVLDWRKGHRGFCFRWAFFFDEGLMNQSLHTAVIDRHQKLAANIEGNQFYGWVAFGFGGNRVVAVMILIQAKLHLNRDSHSYWLTVFLGGSK